MDTLKNNKTIILVTGILFMLFFGSLYTIAATIQLESDATTLGISGQLWVDVTIDSSNQIMNAVSGSIPIDPRITITEIMSGDSAVTFWLEKPLFVPETNSIVFSGVIPGGVVVSDKKLFSMIISGVSAGEVNLSVIDPQILRHDGLGTIIPTDTVPITISVADAYPATVINERGEKNIPEKFLITRSRDAAIFENNWFIIFSTQDKESGINRYEVCELLMRKCQPQQSPYELQNQSSLYMVLVRAYDEQENVQYATLISPGIKIILATVISLGILLLIYGFFFRKTK